MMPIGNSGSGGVDEVWRRDREAEVGAARRRWLLSPRTASSAGQREGMRCDDDALSQHSPVMRPAIMRSRWLLSVETRPPGSVKSSGCWLLSPAIKCRRMLSPRAVTSSAASSRQR